MPANRFAIAIYTLVIVASVLVPFAPVFGQRAGGSAPQAQSAAPDDAKALVARLDLEKYKATIKGLTQFGDRQQGTDRNRAAVDWIEAQLKSYGCTNTERIRYTYNVQPPQPQQSAGTAPSAEIASGEFRAGAGGSRLRGMTRPATPNNDPIAQTDPALRALNSQPPAPGAREQVYCTKVVITHAAWAGRVAFQDGGDARQWWRRRDRAGGGRPHKHP